MGASSSQPSPAELADAALFDEQELRELRSCFELLAPERVLASGSFDGFPECRRCGYLFSRCRCRGGPVAGRGYDW